MLNASRLTTMQAALQRVIGDHPVSIVIRREGVPDLAAQTVRVEFTGTGRSGASESQFAEQTRARVNVVGGIDLDIQKDDRFNALDHLFVVTAVRSNQQIGVMAMADLVQ